MRDYRNRLIQYQDGKRILHKPIKKIEDCFDIQNITYWINVTNKKGKEIELIFYSGINEREFKAENKELFIFN